LARLLGRVLDLATLPPSRLAKSPDVVTTRIVQGGEVYCSVGRAAKMLRTNTMKMKQLMGDGSLDWLNLRVNGRLVVTASSIAAYRRKLIENKRREHQAR